MSKYGHAHLYMQWTCLYTTYNCSKLAWAVSVLFYRGCTVHVCVVKTAHMHILLHSKCKENITTHLAMSLKNYSRSYTYRLHFYRIKELCSFINIIFYIYINYIYNPSISLYIKITHQSSIPLIIQRAATCIVAVCHQVIYRLIMHVLYISLYIL